MLIGHNYSHQPDGKRQPRWDNEIEIEPAIDRYSLRRRVAIWIIAGLMCVAFWTPFIAALLS